MLSVLDNYTLDNPDEIAKEIANDLRDAQLYDIVKDKY